VSAGSDRAVETSLSALSRQAQAGEATTFTARLAAAGYQLHDDDGGIAGELIEGCELYTFCPAHEAEGAHDPSLSIRLLDGKVLSYCHVCCDSLFARIMNGDIPHCDATYEAGDSDGSGSRRGSGGRLMAEIEIRFAGQYAAWCQQQADGIEDVAYLYGSDFAKVRWKSADGRLKAFRCYQKRGSEWRRSSKSDYTQLRIPLYGESRLSEFPGDAAVIAVEGEKDTDALLALEIPAVSSIWIGEPHLECLRGRRVAVIPDNDIAGSEIAGRFQRLAGEVASSVVLMNPLSAVPKSDVSDWLAEGNGADELLVTVEAAFITASDSGTGGHDGGNSGDNGGASEGDGSEEPAGRADWRLISQLADDERYRLPVITAAGDIFFVNRDGVERDWQDGRNNAHTERIAVQPFIVSKMMRSDTGIAYCELSWLALNGEVRCRLVPWDDVSGSRLPAAFGGDAVVIGRHGSACTEYVQELIVANRGLLAEKEERIVTALGWPLRQDDTSFFTAGQGRPHRVADVKNTGPWLAGHEKRGTFAGWRAALELVREIRQVHVFAAASLAAPLLRVTGHPSFAVDLSHGSSTGKSKNIELSAAMWGDPARIVQSWKMTGVAIEHHLAMSRGVPVFADETQLVADPAQVESVVYGLTQGKSKGRSRQAGDQLIDSMRWEAIMLTTGEKPLTSFTQKGGVVPRVVTMCGEAMPGRDVANEVGRAARANYGHAGEAFTGWLLPRLSSRATEITARCQSIEAQLADDATTAVAGRRAGSVAVLALAHELAVEAGILPLPPVGIWEWLAAGGDAIADNDDDKPRKALADILTWAAVNGHRLVGHPSFIMQTQELLGRWNVSSASPYIAIVPEALDRHLESLKYDAEVIRRAWVDRRWVACDGSVSTVKTSLTDGVRINGQRTPRLVRITEVSSLGDDDASLPDGVSLAQWASQNGRHTE
jgi:hypothetical protein